MTEVTRGMKSKTIKQVLSRKFNQWVDSIEDEELAELVRKNTIITGGAIASMLLGEKVNDFDLYFRTRECTHRVAEYYVKRFQEKEAHGIPRAIYVQNGDEHFPDRVMIVVKSAGVASEDGSEQPYDYFEGRPDDDPAAANYVSDIFVEDPGEIEDLYEETNAAAQEVQDPSYRPVFLSTNAITLSDRVQIIVRFYGKPEEIHQNYDFVHCTNYWTSWDNQLVLHTAALEALLSRELRYVGSKYPVCSVIRLRKFIRRGWSINAGQMLKMFMQISAMNLTDPIVLREQLTGVDAAYFTQLLSKLEQKNPDKIDTAYLVEIIDRMF